jgi:hypothetical protein
MADAAKKPIRTVRIYPVEAAIWKNDSEKGAFYSVTFSRTYKDATGYHSSDSFSGADLLVLAKVADLAHSLCEDLRAADKQPEA